MLEELILQLKSMSTKFSLKTPTRWETFFANSYLNHFSDFSVTIFRIGLFFLLTWIFNQMWMVLIQSVEMSLFRLSLCWNHLIHKPLSSSVRINGFLQAIFQFLGVNSDESIELLETSMFLIDFVSAIYNLANNICFETASYLASTRLREIFQKLTSFHGLRVWNEWDNIQG